MRRKATAKATQDAEIVGDRDWLTGLLTRRSFEARWGTPSLLPCVPRCTVAVYDCVGVGSRESAAEAERYIAMCASALNRARPPEAHLWATYRYGGDEFVAVADCPSGSLPKFATMRCAATECAEAEVHAEASRLVELLWRRGGRRTGDR